MGSSALIPPEFAWENQLRYKKPSVSLEGVSITGVHCKQFATQPNLIYGDVT